MRSLTTALALAALPLAAHAQVRIQPRPVQAPKVAIAIDREPALYVYDDYSFDGTTRKTLHYVNDISGADHKKEATYGFQHITADRRGNVYVAVYVGTSEQSKVVQLGKPGWFNGR